MPGASGMGRMEEIMQSLRERPPTVLAGIAVESVRDYLNGVESDGGGSTVAFNRPRSNLLLFTLERTGFRVAIRPSGTEPKIKFYLFAYQAPSEIVSLDYAKRALCDKLLELFDDLMRATGLALDVA